MTIGEQIEQMKAAFLRLPKRQQMKIYNEAKQYVLQKPHMANTNGFWQHLSANHVLQAVNSVNSVK